MVPWESKRDADSRMVEDLIGPHFQKVEAYRYNSASIRVRITDERFRGLSTSQRHHQLLDPIIDILPDRLQSDICFLCGVAPGEKLNISTAFEEDWNEGEVCSKCGK